MFIRAASLNNITPVRRTATGLSNPIVTTNGSTTVTINDTGHGAVLGDFVTCLAHQTLAASLRQT